MLPSRSAPTPDAERPSCALQGAASAPRGFSLVEVVVVLSILAILAGALVPRVSNRMALSRDMRRLADIETIKAAIERYCAEHGSPPPAQENASYGEWDVSQDGAFIPELVQRGYLKETPVDPLNDETYNYRYFVYPAGTAGCKATRPFYVIGIRTFETADFALRNKGGFQCAARNWGDEFAYVTGG
jgi:prepilin-type N-terminal cleavage/methylation domain-containing protein